MKPGTDAHADRLYERGLRILARSSTMETKAQKRACELYERGVSAFAHSEDLNGLNEASELWQRAWELYRRSGNAAKALELEQSLVDLYKHAFAKAHANHASQDENVETFDEWSTFFKIGCFGFGGPMAVFSLLEDELVHRRGILSDNEFLEGAVLGDILPGPVTMDIVTYTGYKLKKWRGALFSTTLFILPSFVLMIVLAVLYDRYSITPRVQIVLKCLGAAATGLILSVGLRLSKVEMKDYREVCLLIWAFFSALILRLDILVIVGFAGLVGMVFYHDGDLGAWSLTKAEVGALKIRDKNHGNGWRRSDGNDQRRNEF